MRHNKDTNFKHNYFIKFYWIIVGYVVALPFRVTGVVVKTITPDVVGDSIYGAGDAIDTVIPF